MIDEILTNDTQRIIFSILLSILYMYILYKIFEKPERNTNVK